MQNIKIINVPAVGIEIIVIQFLKRKIKEIKILFSESKLDSRIKFALSWLGTIKQSILDVYYSLEEFDLKSNLSEVTEADRNTEKLFRQTIRDLFPMDGIIGEEYPEHNFEGEGYTWTIDPIDGTRAFVHGVPFFGTLIGLYKNGESIFGVSAYHALNEVIYGVKDEGTFWKHDSMPDFQRVKASNMKHLEDAVLLISGEEYFKTYGHKKLLNSLKNKVKLTRTWGDCYGYCLLARGKVDIMIDPVLQQWDVVPLKIIVEEAGGIFKSVEKGKSSINTKSAFCFSNSLQELII
ncbi:hypothetical protein MRY82_04805 [bacterium]|nr:hypothetical protein [bacterium]